MSANVEFYANGEHFRLIESDALWVARDKRQRIVATTSEVDGRWIAYNKAGEFAWADTAVEAARKVLHFV